MAFLEMDPLSTTQSLPNSSSKSHSRLLGKIFSSSATSFTLVVLPVLLALSEWIGASISRTRVPTARAWISHPHDPRLSSETSHCLRCQEHRRCRSRTGRPSSARMAQRREPPRGQAFVHGVHGGRNGYRGHRNLPSIRCGSATLLEPPRGAGRAGPGGAQNRSRIPAATVLPVVRAVTLSFIRMA